MVTSYAEVWIEILFGIVLDNFNSSPPTRRCGLKSATDWKLIFDSSVTSYAEVWIEINVSLKLSCSCAVTSYAEVWIEIYNSFTSGASDIGHLLRGGVD